MSFNYNDHNDNDYSGFYRPRKPDTENTTDTHSDFYAASRDPQTSYGTSQQPPVVDIKPSGHKQRNRRIVAGTLAGVLALGCAFGLGYGADRLLNTTNTSVYMSNREPVEVTPMAINGKDKMSYSQLYETVVNSCVSINASATTNFFGQQATTMASAGSGFILTKDGYIVTNYHVIEGGDSVSVTLYDGTVLDAKIVGGDKEFDIAVLKVDTDIELTPVVIGKSEDLSVGDDVAAIGNPLGELSFSMSEGIVSTTDRWINVSGTPFNMIQITAAVNSGNSGGPLFNMYGEVVGIVSAKLSSDGSSSSASVEGLGFAIPIDDVINLLEDIIENGYVTNKPYLAITAQTFSRQMNPNVPVNSGVYVYSTEEGGAAQKAGLQPGDVIVKIGDEEISAMEDVEALRKTYTAGDTVTVTFYRGSEEKTTELTFDAMPETTSEPQVQPQSQDTSGSYMDPWDFFNYYFD